MLAGESTKAGRTGHSVRMRGEAGASVGEYASRIDTAAARVQQRVILGLAGDVFGKAVLDVGCGDGALALALAKRGAVVTGIDSCGAMIDAARKRAADLGADIAFERANAGWLPFQPEYFEVITAVMVLCFLDDAQTVLREAARALKPGGRLIIAEPGRWSPWAVGRRLLAWRGASLWRHTRFRGARELLDLVQGAGLLAEPVRGSNSYRRLTSAVPLESQCDMAVIRLTTIGGAFVALSARRPEAYPRSLALLREGQCPGLRA